MEEVITNNENETIDFAYNFAKALKKGEFLALLLQL